MPIFRRKMKKESASRVAAANCHQNSISVLQAVKPAA
jgi:hypothetical protein